MKKDKNIVPKQKILATAASLFSEKGYHAVGVREIAKTADVNISMISYYFGGKAGILKEIMTQFFDSYFRILSVLEDDNLSPEKCIKSLVRQLVDYIYKNRDIALTGWFSIYLDLPEINDWKNEKQKQNSFMMRKLVEKFGFSTKDVVEVGMIGPSLMSILFSKAKKLPFLMKLYDFQLTDDVYEKYIYITSSLFLYGIKGLAKDGKIK